MVVSCGVAYDESILCACAVPVPVRCVFVVGCSPVKISLAIALRGRVPTAVQVPCCRVHVTLESCGVVCPKEKHNIVRNLAIIAMTATCRVCDSTARNASYHSLFNFTGCTALSKLPHLGMFFCLPVKAMSASSCHPAVNGDGRIHHVVFTDEAIWTEGMGAKWRFVKLGLWFALRLRQRLHGGDAGNVASQSATVAWLPNPAEMQNPHVADRMSMMGGLGILQPTAPPPALHGRSAQWLHACVDSGEFRRVNVTLQMTLAGAGAAEASVVDSLRDWSNLPPQQRQPLAFFVSSTKLQPMHWHGSAGAWLHAAFFTHRKARARRAASETAWPALPGLVTTSERFVIAVHLRQFRESTWNLPPSYFVSAIKAVFTFTPLRCANTAILIVGQEDAPAARTILDTFPECSVSMGTSVEEVR